MNKKLFLKNPSFRASYDHFSMVALHADLQGFDHDLGFYSSLFEVQTVFLFCVLEKLRLSFMVKVRSLKQPETKIPFFVPLERPRDLI